MSLLFSPASAAQVGLASDKRRDPETLSPRGKRGWLAHPIHVILNDSGVEPQVQRCISDHPDTSQTHMMEDGSPTTGNRVGAPSCNPVRVRRSIDV